MTTEPNILSYRDRFRDGRPPFLYTIARKHFWRAQIDTAQEEMWYELMLKACDAAPEELDPW